MPGATTPEQEAGEDRDLALNQDGSDDQRRLRLSSCATIAVWGLGGAVLGALTGLAAGYLLSLAWCLVTEPWWCLDTDPECGSDIACYLVHLGTILIVHLGSGLLGAVIGAIILSVLGVVAANFAPRWVQLAMIGAGCVLAYPWVLLAVACWALSMAALASMG